MVQMYMVASVIFVTYRTCISGTVYNKSTGSKNYRDRVTDILIIVKAIKRHHLNIISCLNKFGITYEVSEVIF